jgi:histidinol dehydrogenase
MKIINFSDVTEEFFQKKDAGEVSESVKKILEDVKNNGDDAVRKYSKEFDDLDLDNFELTKEQIKKAYEEVSKKTIEVLKFAAGNISKFAKKQLKSFNNFEEEMGGITLGQKISPLERVGCYVPGGRYPLPSTALMAVIPARVAGVEEVIVCSPKISPVTIVAADIAGADRIFNLGGVQAIGALAYGTKTIPKVDKIIGPGNQYVAEAKKEVYGLVGIDMIAGPSEVLIIADETGNPGFIAADLLAQAEHDPNSRAELITSSKELAERVSEEVSNQIEKLKTKDIAEQAIKNSSIIIVKDFAQAASIANKRAPEHLEVQIKNPDLILDDLKNYGSLFVGEYSAEVFGDYCSGPNHTLPTNGTARYTGGLSVKDFLKILTYQKISKEASPKLIEVASKLAELEGLDAHKAAAEIRKS